MIGTTISHYRITDEIGRGGMGVVYKAEDTKLDRTVALKFLPPQALITEEDRARFYREARAAAALHHPNIATVFEIDEVAVPGASAVSSATSDVDTAHPEVSSTQADGRSGRVSTTPLIAMEYIEGETLAERVSRGPFPLEEAIAIASQIADGLHAAHEKDIVHRDVKCGNVMITKKGVAKILDFGLAKTTASTRLTQMGSTLGTAAYMSPEQARGEEVDHRSDTWSLGVILYEMVSGRLPFQGDYEQAVVYGILNAAPEPLTGLRTGVPMELELIVEKCLDKDSRKRYGSAAEIRVDLERIDLTSVTRSRTGIMPAAAAVTSPPPKAKALWAAGGLIAGIVMTAVAFVLLRPGGTPADRRALSPVHRLSLNLPPEAPLTPVGAANLGVGLTALRLSPDGRNLVYVADVGGVPKLAVRSMDGEDARILEGTDGAYYPFFSPDGSWVGFFSDGQLKKVSIDGGSPLLVSAAPDPFGAYWANDDRIITVISQGSMLRAVGAGGGEPVLEKSGLRWNQASLLPDGKTLLAGDRGRGSILAVSLETLEGNMIIERGTDPRYVESGHIIYSLPGRLMAVPFDVESLSVTGSAVPVVDNVRTESVASSAQYTVSANGTLVYVPGGASDVGRLTWVDRAGRATDLGFEPDLFGTFRISPDGNRIAAVVRQPSLAVWIYDLIRRTRSRAADGGGTPVWTLDGRSILHRASSATGTTSIVEVPVSGGPATPLVDVATSGDAFSWSPDGSLLAYYSDFDLWLLPVDEGVPGTPRKWLGSDDREWSPAISPDGRFIAYTLIGEGNSEVFVGPIEGGDVRWQISADGGEEPVWSPDGDELYYSRGRTWYAVQIETSPRFEAGVPRVLFEGNYLNVPGQGYDVHPDGSRFLVVESNESDAPVGELKVVENWFDELKRLAPTESGL